MDVNSFIECVSKKEPIWNKWDLRYSNRTIVDACWKEISTQLDCEEALLRKKWKYLRDNFAVEFGKTLLSMSKEAPDNFPPSRWQYFQQLMFLKDVVTPRPACGPNSTNSNSSSSSVWIPLPGEADQTEQMKQESESQSLTQTLCHIPDKTEDELTAANPPLQFQSPEYNMNKIEEDQEVKPQSKPHFQPQPKSQFQPRPQFQPQPKPQFQPQPKPQFQLQPKSQSKPQFQLQESPSDVQEDGYTIPSTKLINKRKRNSLDFSDSSNDDNGVFKEERNGNFPDVRNKPKRLLQLQHMHDAVSDEENCDMMFFKTLLPHTKLIPQHMKLQFQSQILTVVQEYAYNSTSTSTQPKNKNTIPFPVQLHRSKDFLSSHSTSPSHSPSSSHMFETGRHPND